MGQVDLCKFIRPVRMSPRRRLYVLTLIGLTTVAWTVLFAGGLLLGVLPSASHVPGLCHFTGGDSPNCHNQRHKHIHQPTVAGNNLPIPVPVVKFRNSLHFEDRGSRDTQASVMQLRKPPSVPLAINNSTKAGRMKPKIILRWTMFYGKDWGVPQGNAIFRELSCAEQNCLITDDKNRIRSADAVLVHMRDIREPGELPTYRAPRQRWVMLTLESPYHSENNLTRFNGVFNWTSTYTDDSDVPCTYGEYVPHELAGRAPPLHAREKPPPRVALRQKSRTAAWFVTNCKTKNKREWFIGELQKYVQVDVYGVCGRLKCKDTRVCQEMLRQRYKFYVAFENSSCKQYITEKFWANALQNDIVPIVMGASAVDYERLAPPHSFIHIDNFSSPRELARHLKILYKNLDVYSEYFNWKNSGTARSYVNFKPSKSRYWCDLCEALHNKELPRKTHWGLDSWWSVENQCTS